MSSISHKLKNRAQRKGRIRSTVIGTPERPRLSAHFSLMHVSAQIIDDSSHKTLVAVSTVGAKQTGSLTDKAAWVGAEVAKKAKAAKLKKVVFDRSGKMYHGRVKAMADAARKEGLEF